MYSERAYVLSCGFVRHALNHPPSGLEEEIRWLYLTRGKLKKVINDGRSLIAHSKKQQNNLASNDAPDSSPLDAERAIERLTLGCILPLERTLTQLHSILVNRAALS